MSTTLSQWSWLWNAYRPEPSIFGRPEAKKGPSKGMQLGKANKSASTFIDSLRAEGENVDVSRSNRGPSQASEAPSMQQRPSEPIAISLEESIRAVLNNNGGVEEVVIDGTVYLQVRCNYSTVSIRRTVPLSNEMFPL